MSLPDKYMMDIVIFDESVSEERIKEIEAMCTVHLEDLPKDKDGRIILTRSVEDEVHKERS